MKFTKSLAAVAVIGMLIGTSVYAADTMTPSQSHEEHHPDMNGAPADMNQMNMDKKGGMNGMDMSQMKGMMHECKQHQKDGKMCDHEMMEKCEAKMGKDSCKKMMNHSKKEEKSETK